MRRGKASEAVLDRSVLRQLHSEHPLVRSGPAYGKSCGRLEVPEGQGLACTSLCDVYTGAEWEAGGALRPFWTQLALAQAANDLAAEGSAPAALSVQLLLPQTLQEPFLKQWMKTIDGECARLGIQVIGGHTQITDAAARPALSGTMLGICGKKTGEAAKAGCFAPGQDLVMIGWAGMAGTAALAAVKEEELSERYPLAFLDEAKALARYLYAGAAVAKAWQHGAFAVYALSAGGVLGGLWEMAEGAGLGLEIGLRRIPIRQESVEICEHYGLNPYSLNSCGAVLIGAKNGQAMAEALSVEGIPAALIGRTTAGNDRVLQNGEDKSYLNRPAPDELLNIIKA